MLVVLGTLATQQANPTAQLWEYITLFLIYAATHLDANIYFKASDLILYVSSDWSYLSETHSRSCSCVGGIFNLSSKLPAHNLAPDLTRSFNAPIHVVAKILKRVTSSAMETEVAATFYNAKEDLPFRVTLQQMDHPQPPTPMEVDNETAIGFIKRTMKQRHSKAIDMRFYWMQDRVDQQQFLIYWKPGPTNLEIYVSKQHSPGHHQLMRPKKFVCLILPTPLSNYIEKCLQKVFSCLQRGCDNSTRNSSLN